METAGESRPFLLSIHERFLILAVRDATMSNMPGSRTATGFNNTLSIVGAG